MQNGPQMSAPSQHRGHYMPPPQQQQPLGLPHGFDPRMHHQYGPNGFVQSSPRFAPAQIAYPGQMPGMPMTGYGGPQQMQMQGYGMSPSMGYRTVNMGGSGGPGQPQMMMPGQQGHGQSKLAP